MPDKQQWDTAIKFMEKTLQHEHDKTWTELNNLIGPGWQDRWLYWKYRTHDQVCCLISFILLIILLGISSDGTVFSYLDTL